MSIMDDIKAYGPNQLSGYADCAGPDTLDSAGAKFLTHVRDALVESVEYVQGSEGLSLREATESVRDGDARCEIADGAPSVYTHELWSQFVDLAAYREDIEDFGEPSGDMNRNAGLALYMIADRLVGALLDEIEEHATKFVATINVPGYLPMDDEPPVFDDPAEAWAYLEQERQDSEENAAEGDYFVASDCLTELRRLAEATQTFGGDVTGTVYGDTPGYDGDHDLGLAYSVQEYEGDEV